MRDNSVHIIAKNSLDVRIKSHDSPQLAYTFSASIDLPCHAFGATRADAVTNMIARARADLAFIEAEANKQLGAKS